MNLLSINNLSKLSLRMCMAGRLELEMSKSGSKEQDLIAKTCGVKFEGITYSN